MSDAVLPIPWKYTDSPGVLLWTWSTEHLSARIMGYEVPNPDDLTGARIIKSYNWELSDLIKRHQGMPRLLIEGVAATFEDAEHAIREHIGKCYDPRLGYGPIAGPWAFRFTIATGEVLDIRPFVNTRCAVTVLLPDGTETTVIGDLATRGYKWRLNGTESVLELTPEHVVSVTNRSEAAERAASYSHLDSYSGIGRIYKEEPRRGCTGRPGFTVGTVDHAGAPRCPIHEVSVPDDMLR